jgi:hypothetical protein
MMRSWQRKGSDRFWAERGLRAMSSLVMALLFLSALVARAHTLPISYLTVVPDSEYAHLELTLNPSAMPMRLSEPMTFVRTIQFVSSKSSLCSTQFVRPGTEIQVSVTRSLETLTVKTGGGGLVTMM